MRAENKKIIVKKVFQKSTFRGKWGVMKKQWKGCELC